MLARSKRSSAKRCTCDFGSFDFPLHSLAHADGEVLPIQFCECGRNHISIIDLAESFSSVGSDEEGEEEATDRTINFVAACSVLRNENYVSEWRSTINF